MFIWLSIDYTCDKRVLALEFGDQQFPMSVSSDNQTYTAATANLSSEIQLTFPVKLLQICWFF